MMDMLDSPGVSIGNEMLEFIREDERIRPIEDRIFIDPLPIDHKTDLNVVYQGRPVRGVVVAVGPGVNPWKYDGPKGRRTKRWRSHHFVPCDVKVGDIVDFGGLEREGYLFPRVYHGTKELVVCREADVCVVREQ